MLCTKCEQQDISMHYHTCSKHPSEKYCCNCFAATPCAQGEHGDGCETISDQEMLKHRIKFTHYARPDGRTTIVYFTNADPELKRKADAIVAAGHRFEIEQLRDGTISITIFSLNLEEDVAIELSPNGPQLPDAVEKLINHFYPRINPELSH